jgi:hypothetical protein
MEIETGDDMGGVQPFAQDAMNEVGGRKLRKAPVEGIFDDGPKAHSLEDAGFQRCRGEAEYRRVGPEHGTRMRLEGEHERRNGPLHGLLQRAVQHRLMAAVHAVEIADRDHTAAKMFGQRIAGLVAVKNGHADRPVMPAAASTISAGPHSASERP